MVGGVSFILNFGGVFMVTYSLLKLSLADLITYSLLLLRSKVHHLGIHNIFSYLSVSFKSIADPVSQGRVPFQGGNFKEPEEASINTSAGRLITGLERSPMFGEIGLHKSALIQVTLQQSNLLLASLSGCWWHLSMVNGMRIVDRNTPGSPALRYRGQSTISLKYLPSVPPAIRLTSTERNDGLK
jgi:hypothetical protein